MVQNLYKNSWSTTGGI